MTETSPVRRGVALGTVLIVLGAVTTYLSGAVRAQGQVAAVRGAALIGAWKYERKSTAPAAAVPAATIRRAVMARPLDPRIVNVAMFQAYARGGDAILPKWLPVVARLGWRDTPTLQNRLFVFATNNDLGGVMRVSDALMRRQQLQDQVIPVLSMVEAVPSARRDLVRLLRNSSWRERYLFTTGHLKTAEQLTARRELFDDLTAQGVAIDRGTMVSNVATMVAGGQPALAFATWTRFNPTVQRPLYDPRFAIAGRKFTTGDPSLPFEWQFENGNGFSATPYAEDGASALDIRWNGRGVPLFAHQRTSALPGSYRLQVSVPPEKTKDLPAIGFRMRCDGVVYRFTGATDRPGQFETREPVACAFPEFEIVGDIAAQGTPRQIDLKSLRLTRVGGTVGAGE